MDNLTVIKTTTSNITIRKALDEITIRDIEDVIAGTSSLEVTITARAQEDDLTIIRPPTTNLTIKD